MLAQRVLTVAVTLPLLLAAMFLLPNDAWRAALLAPVAIAGHEWARLGAFGRGAEAAFLALLLAGCVALWPAAITFVAPGAYSGSVAERAVLAIALAFWLVIAPCWLWLKLVVRRRAVLAITGFIVLVPMWVAAARLQENALMLLLLLGVIWLADSAAYFTGRALGRHRLAPAISPAKTWEGVGGAFAAVVVYAFALRFFLETAHDGFSLMVAAIGMTALATVGDLFESWLKRCAGVKDSGRLFPGHGGMLDRIDSVAAALPLAALIFIWNAV